MITALVLLFRCYELVIVARVILSWMQVDPRNPAVALIVRITEPVLEPIRRLLPTGKMGFDLSPLIAIFALGLVERLLVRGLL
ncbi:MAG: YggT family protein [Chitinispirillaceae bacterium]|nr:YggT family protein [Chitinispirillaceae bacterium]